MADRPESLESVGRVSNRRHPRLMSCDECPRWTRSPSPSSPSPFSSSSPALHLAFLCSSFFRTRFALASPFLSSILRSLRRGSSRSSRTQERESRMTDSVESLFRSANRKLETSDRVAMPRPHDKKVRAAPPSKPACKICRSVVDPRGRVLCTSADFAILHLPA